MLSKPRAMLSKPRAAHKRVLHSAFMHNYRLVRKGALVEIFIDGHASPGKTVNANLHNELRNFFASCKVPQADIDHKVHELYTTNTTSFSTE